jgi:hypothetical protein
MFVPALNLQRRLARHPSHWLAALTVTSLTASPRAAGSVGHR